MSTETLQYQVKAALTDIEPFTVCGISVLTNNQKASEDINALWERFFKEQIGQKIPNKENNIIYAVYSDYEGDHTKPYRYTLGHRVTESEELNNFHHIECQAGPYAVLSAKGSQPRALIESWRSVWEGDLARAYRTDFELYGPRFFEEGVHEILLHIGIKEN